MEPRLPFSDLFPSTPPSGARSRHLVRAMVIVLTLVVTVAGRAGWAAEEIPSFQILFCENPDSGHTNRSLGSLGCRAGYEEISRGRYIEQRFKSGQLSASERAYFAAREDAGSRDQFDETLKAVTVGTAIFINDDGILVTNNHVVETCKDFAVISLVDLFRAEFVARAEVRDLAVLRTKMPAPGNAVLREDGARIGERVFAFGFPFLTKLRAMVMSQGIVSAAPVLGIEGMFQMTTPIQPGSSGGPVIDNNGTLVGVSMAKLDKGENVNFAIEASELIRLLRQEGIPFVSKERDRTAKDPEVIAEDATRFTFPILCLG